MLMTYQALSMKPSSGSGRMKKDSQGYVDIVLGAMNDYNSAGEYYTMRGAEKIFEGSSIFSRRIKEGQLFGELSHPSMEKGMTRKEYFRRLLQIDDKSVSSHIKEVTLDSELWKKNKRTMSEGSIAVIGKVKPYGPYADVALEAINTPSINLAYSVRSFTKNTIRNGTTVKCMVELVTWDQVGSQGIASANKWSSPGLELLVDDIVTEDDLLYTANELSLVGNESMANSVLALLDMFSSESDYHDLTVGDDDNESPIWTKW